MGHLCSDFSKRMEKEQPLVGETPDLIKCLRTLNERCEGDTCGANQQIPFTRLGCLRRGSEEKMLWMWMCSGNRKPSPDEALNFTYMPVYAAVRKDSNRPGGRSRL